MGTSTAGIAHAALTADILDLPMGYVRSGAKDHGRQNQIEGRLEKGQKVVVVEDLISTAGSVLEVVVASDVAEKRGDVVAGELNGTCPNHITCLVVVGSTSAVKAAMDAIQLKLG